MTLRHSCISSEDKLKLLESFLFEGEPDQAILFPFGQDPHSEKPPPTTRTARKDICDFIYEINQEVACIDKQLRTVRAIHDSLKQRRSAFIKSRVYHRFQLAPIRLLPDELLLYIFQEMGILEAYGNKGRSTTTFDMQKCPWVLIHVCRRWRSIVVSAPSMWTNINLIISTLATRSLPPYGAPELLRLYLKRSQTSPLDVKIFYSVIKAESVERPWNPSALFQTLLDHGDHIRFFDVDIGINDSDLHDVRAVQFPQLLTLRFRGTIPGWLLESLIMASQLYKLDIDPDQFHRTLALPHIITLYNRITVLFLGSEFRDANTELVLHALATMPNLKQCRFCLYPHDEDFYGPLPPLPPPPISIIMKALSVLQVYNIYDNGDGADIFSPLTLPSLKILKLYTSYSDPRILRTH